MQPDVLLFEVLVTSELTDTDLNHLVFYPQGLMWQLPPNQCQRKVSPFDRFLSITRPSVIIGNESEQSN